MRVSRNKRLTQQMMPRTPASTRTSVLKVRFRRRSSPTHLRTAAGSRRSFRSPFHPVWLNRRAVSPARRIPCLSAFLVSSLTLIKTPVRSGRLQITFHYPPQAVAGPPGLDLRFGDRPTELLGDLDDAHLLGVQHMKQCPVVCRDVRQQL